MIKAPIHLAAIFCALVEASLCSAAPQKPAATMHDVQSHFKSCLSAVHTEDGSRIMVYFSLKRDGHIFGRPRAVWFGPSGNEEERKSILADFLRSFENCTPLDLDRHLAQLIPGKVYFLQYSLQYAEAANGPQVIVRPFGSEGPPLNGWW